MGSQDSQTTKFEITVIAIVPLAKVLYPHYLVLWKGLKAVGSMATSKQLAFSAARMRNQNLFQFEFDTVTDHFGLSDWGSGEMEGGKWKGENKCRGPDQS